MPPAPREKSQAVVFTLSEAQKATIKRFWEEWSRSSKKAPPPVSLTAVPGAPARASAGSEPGSSGGTPRPG